MDFNQNDRLSLYAYLLPPQFPKNTRTPVFKKNRFTTVLENKNE